MLQFAAFIDWEEQHHHHHGAVICAFITIPRAFSTCLHRIPPNTYNPFFPTFHDLNLRDHHDLSSRKYSISNLTQYVFTPFDIFLCSL